MALVALGWLWWRAWSLLRLPGEMHLYRSSSNLPRLPLFLKLRQNLHVFSSLLTRCTIPCACHARRLLNIQKCSVAVIFFCIFELEMCFAPQWRALFRHLNFQKWSEHGVFCTFWLRNVFCATTACTFSTSQLRKVVREWCVCTFWLGNVLRATRTHTF